MSNAPLLNELKQLALPASEVAKLLGISLRHVQNLHSKGDIPRPVRLGRSVRWPVDELRAWLAAGAPKRDRWEKAGLREHHQLQQKVVSQ